MAFPGGCSQESRALSAPARGSGHASRKMLDFRPSEIVSGAICGVITASLGNFPLAYCPRPRHLRYPKRYVYTHGDRGVVTVTVRRTLLRRPEAAFKSRLMGYSSTLTPQGTPTGWVQYKALASHDAVVLSLSPPPTPDTEKVRRQWPPVLLC